SPGRGTSQAVAAKLPRIVAGQGGAGLDDLGDAAIGESRSKPAVPGEGTKQRPLGQARRGEPGGERAGGAAEDRQLDALAGLVGLAAAEAEEIAAVDRGQVLDARRGNLGARAASGTG
ncbi:MAG TPA: hypothetical protein VN999_11230, partial [Thermoanaerobaculia bacterium]|nr:hypothetical protein [Thermoanaerobaculia bacterium]